MTNLTQQEVQKLFLYNKETGTVKRKIHAGPVARAGDIVGTINLIRGKYKAVYVKINGKRYILARVIWLFVTGKWPKEEIDHIDQDPTNNSWINLRDVSRAENARNCSKFSHNTSGITGVSWSKANEKWQAYIRVAGKLFHLGFFHKKETAAAVRKVAEEKLNFTLLHGK